MRAIDAPTVTPVDVFTQCVSSISETSLRERLLDCREFIRLAADNYLVKAKAKRLYCMPSNNLKNDQICIVNVTKKELKDVYSSHMVPRTKPARLMYDSLVGLAPLGRCPYCGLGQASTLDHYLPKAKFPELSVVPCNLVPSCNDCNTGKLSGFATSAGDQCLHPYFDHQMFIDEQWLYATVSMSSPVSVIFFVEPPDNWDDISKARVRTHFREFCLSRRYSLEASNELACLRGMFAGSSLLNIGAEVIKQQLHDRASSYSKLHQNSWQTALYHALSNSDWYCDGGYL